jgi:ABC-2 type transport system permease protein
MFVREYRRTTLNVVLLVAIPALVIVAIGDSIGRISRIFETGLTTAMAESMGALWAAAFLTGMMGFFMITGARGADRRLVAAGYGALEVVALRFAVVALFGGVATLASYALLLTRVEPTDHLQMLIVMYLAALLYGALGVLIGSLVAGELEGSFALLFFFIFDAFIASPLFGDAGGFPLNLLPTFYPTTVLLSVTAGQPHAAEHWIYIGAYALVVGTLAASAFYRAARRR